MAAKNLKNLFKYPVDDNSSTQEMREKILALLDNEKNSLKAAQIIESLINDKDS